MASLSLRSYSTMKPSFISLPSSLSVLNSIIWPAQNSGDRSPKLKPFQPSELPNWAHMPTYFQVMVHL